MYKDRHLRTEKMCEWCGKIFMAQNSRIKLGQGRFCSLKCANYFQKEDSKKTWGKENGRIYWYGVSWKLQWIENGKTKVMSYPRYLWENNFGDIPKGFLVSFKDNDPHNIDLDNLYLISRSELSAIQGKKQLGVPKPTIAGENSKWWRGGVSQGGYPQTFTKPLKKRIKIRDNYTCQCCYSEYSTENLDVHHIDRDIANNDDENLVTVCKSCHKGIHGKSSKTNDRIRYFQSLLPD